MTLVKITSPGVSIALELELEDDETLSHFLIVDGRSSARNYLLRTLNLGYFEGRPEWNAAQIMKDFKIKIPTLNLEYILQGEEIEIEIEPQLEQEQPKEEQNKKTITKWSHRAVLRLIHHWTIRRKRFENNIDKNDIVWEDLTEAMAAEGFPFSSSQCENKFKYIKRIYMETKDFNRKSTGQPEKICPFYDELDEILKKSAQASPPTLVSSRDGAPSQSSVRSPFSDSSSNEIAENTSSDTIPTDDDTSHPPIKKTRLESSLTKWAEKFQEKTTDRETARQKRHEELMQMQRETNELYKNMMTKLLEKL